MSRLDFLYRMDLPHRAVSVYIYLYAEPTKTVNAGLQFRQSQKN